MKFLACLLTKLIDMIVKIQVITSVDPQHFNDVLSSHGAARDLNFQFLFRAQY